MSERDNAHGHKTHRPLIVDHQYERHIKPILDHEPFCQGTREKNSTLPSRQYVGAFPKMEKRISCREFVNESCL